jgi:hypothetical protein
MSQKFENFLENSEIPWKHFVLEQRDVQRKIFPKIVKSNKEDANAKLMMLASSRSIVLWSTSDQTTTTISKKKFQKDKTTKE